MPVTSSFQRNSLSEWKQLFQWAMNQSFSLLLGYVKKYTKHITVSGWRLDYFRASGGRNGRLTTTLKSGSNDCNGMKGLLWLDQIRKMMRIISLGRFRLPSNQKRELLLALEIKKVELTPSPNARDHHMERKAEQRYSVRPERTQPNQRNKSGSYYLYIRGAAHFTDQLVITLCYFAIGFLNLLAACLFVETFGPGQDEAIE